MIFHTYELIVKTINCRKLQMKYKLSIHLTGRFEMEGVEMFDFEDIALGPGPEGPDGPDYIYVGDIGNNWDGHCRGINADDYVVYRIPEPDIDTLR